MSVHPLLLSLTLFAAVTEQASASPQEKLVDRKAGRPMLLVFDVAPGYMDSVQLPVQSDEDEEAVTLRMLVEPPEDEDWASGHWNPTSFLCLAPEAPSKASYCANVSLDRSRLSYGLATVVSATGEKLSRNQTSRQFEAHVRVDLSVVRKGQHVTTTIGGEVIDEKGLAFVPVVWRIGASTGTSKIEIIDEPEAAVAPGDWPVTLDAAVAGELARMSSTSKATLRGMRKEDMHQFRVGWGTELRERLGLARGNDALLEAACGKGCAPDAAAMAIMEAAWSALQDPSR